MKLNRLLEITIILLNRGTVKARELAERFNVSTRTIYRDIDALSSAGVPVYMSKGNGGGISLLEDFSLSKTFLSGNEWESLILALQTMGVTRYPENERVLEKLGSIFNTKTTADSDWIEIDFAGWASLPNEKGRLEIIRGAIINKKIIEFDYINASGISSRRSVEPEKLYFNTNTWYLFAYCQMKSASRVFRFSRIKNVVDTGREFISREKVQDSGGRLSAFTKPHVRLKLLFGEEALYRLYDEFNEGCITKTKQGYEVNVAFPEDEWVYGFLLSFGPYVRILEPEHIRDIVVNKMKAALRQYDEDFKYDNQLSRRGHIVESSNKQEEEKMMIEAKSRKAQPVLYLRVKTNLANLTEAFDEGYKKIEAYLAELGEKSTGSPYGAYYNSDMADIDMEMGFPVSGELPAKGDIKYREIPAMEKTVCATHEGSYNSLSDTYNLVYGYISENKLSMAGPHYDFYINNPDTTPESELLTEVVIPVSSEPAVFCQSCSMPITNEELAGTLENGEKSSDYCVYCFENGEFTSDVSMEEMINSCLGFMKEENKSNPDFDADGELEKMRAYFPTLKRWRK